jgi:hypothetical protein
MQRLWSAEELGERWTLGAEDLALLSGLPEIWRLFQEQGIRIPYPKRDLYMRSAGER